MAITKLKFLIALVVVFTLTFGLVGQAVAATGQDRADWVRKIMAFNNTVRSPKAQEVFIDKLGWEPIKELPVISGWVVLVPPQAEIPEVGGGVRWVEDDATLYAVGDELDWGVNRIDADKVWGDADGATDVGAGRNAGAGVDVAIIDTGIDYTHVDLNDNYIADGWDYVNNDGDPMDDNGHGTYVAGIVAAEDNDIGMIGVAPQAKLHGLKVLNADGVGYYSDLIDALSWVFTNQPDVANMSLGGRVPSRSLKLACENVYERGVLLVAAAGNDGRSKIDYPAKYDFVIAVSATDSIDSLWAGSNYGDQIELAAPGVSIKSTFLGNSYAIGTGTSAATPHVTGAAALVVASGVATRSVAVRQQLNSTAEDLLPEGRDNYFGYGLVDAEAAVVALPPPPPAGTMHVEAIDMWYVQKGKNFFVYTKVTIWDATNNPVSGATVYLRTTVPDGITPYSAVTEDDGTVTFKLRHRLPGSYISNVNIVKKNAWDYDLALSLTKEPDSDADDYPDEVIVVP